MRRGLEQHRSALIEAQQLRNADSASLQRLQLELDAAQETHGRAMYT